MKELKSVQVLDFLSGKDGTYTLVAADGTKTTGMTDYAPVKVDYSSWPDGKLWVATNEAGNVCLIDWHGNTLLEGFESVEISDNSKYMVVEWWNWGEGFDADFLMRLLQYMQ